jgi:hypothetical protein
MTAGPEDKLRLDYEETLRQVRLLTDIRFKLLAFVPTITGLSVAVLTDAPPAAPRLALGLLGGLVTLGILFYELRNTKLYDGAMHRARCLETLLDLPVCTQGAAGGGLTSERPGRAIKLFGLVTIWHDRGLALVYGAALGGWGYLTIDAAAAIVGPEASPWALPGAALLAALFIWEIHRLDRRHKPQPSEELRRGRSRKAAAEPTDDQHDED